MRSAVHEADRVAFRRDGFVVRRGVFDHRELTDLVHHYKSLRGGPSEVGDGDDRDSAPRRWPRLMQPHEHDPASRHLLVDRRLMSVPCELLGVQVFGFQTMWYWKPPGALGQALHQDEYYVRSVGGPCIAAWLAVDSTDDANGCLRVVPGSHRTPLQCPHEADPAVSISRHEVAVPTGLDPIAVEMEAGDVLYFDGCLIHGSMPNRTDRWRRTFVAHYLPATTLACADGYNRLVDVDGMITDISVSGPDSDPCGGPSF